VFSIYHLVTYELDGESSKGKLLVSMSNGEALLSIMDSPPMIKTLCRDKVLVLVDVLGRHGYLTDQERAELEAASGRELPHMGNIAKFLYMNVQANKFVVFPLWMAFQQALALVEEKGVATNLWNCCPRDLVFIEPVGATGGKANMDRYGGNRAAGMAKGGGPFFLWDSPQLVRTILHRLRYIDSSDGGVCAPAVRLFCERNCARISKHSVDTSCENLEGLVAALRRVFTSSPHQQWKTCFQDHRVRHDLLKNGLISTTSASRADVVQGIRQMLGAGTCLPTDVYYWSAVAAYMDKRVVSRDPSSRR